jgi:enoyl-CoA hydratase/carnithine racemase
MSEPVEIKRESGIQVLRLNRPEKKNALTSAMYKVLAESLNAANSDDAIAVTVILGQPGIFCAGNDIADFLAASQGGGPLWGMEFIKALAECDKPLIAAVDGPAIGIGTTLMLHCDLVFASPRAVFQTPFVDLGLLPEAGSSLLGPRVLGHVRAFELLAMGAPWTAQQAKDAGLVNQLVEPEDLEGVALKAADALAQKPRQALRLARRLLRGDVAEVKSRMQEEGALFLERVKSEEARDAFMAFLQKTARFAG